METWQSIPEAQGYLASNLGRIWRNDKLIVACLNRSGYHVVNIIINGHRTTRTVGSLVLIAFVGEQGRGYRPCHIDGDRLNDNLDNLHWRKDNNFRCDHVKGES